LVARFDQLKANPGAMQGQRGRHAGQPLTNDQNYCRPSPVDGLWTVADVPPPVQFTDARR